MQCLHMKVHNNHSCISSVKLAWRCMSLKTNMNETIINNITNDSTTLRKKVGIAVEIQSKASFIYDRVRYLDIDLVWLYSISQYWRIGLPSTIYNFLFTKVINHYNVKCLYCGHPFYSRQMHDILIQGEIKRQMSKWSFIRIETFINGRLNCKKMFGWI